MISPPPDGLASGGADGSGFSTTKLESPPETGPPPGMVISSTFTVMLAVGLVEVAKTGRAAPECAAMERSRLVFVGFGGGGVGGLGGGLLVPGRNDAYPPLG